MKIKVALNSEKTQYDIICNDNVEFVRNEKLRIVLTNKLKIMPFPKLENEIYSAIYEAFNLDGIRISNLEIGENVVYSTGQTISEIEYYITL
ncbi:MAG: hypothetical protein IKW35_05535 [Paludibacteraceae bacterium]|nr:hypothetical protein [Paludibacteraceae bacterium]